MSINQPTSLNLDLINILKQERHHEFEGGGGGGSMHWKVRVNIVKTLQFEKGGGACPSPSSYGGAAPAYLTKM